MKTLLVKTVCRALGAGHFVAQSTADILLESEASLATCIGKDKSETKEWRKSKTTSYQDNVLASRDRMVDRFRKQKSLLQPK